MLDLTTGSHFILLTQTKYTVSEVFRSFSRYAISASVASLTRRTTFFQGQQVGPAYPITAEPKASLRLHEELRSSKANLLAQPVEG